jgi:DNA mismatch repair protein MutS2
VLDRAADAKSVLNAVAERFPRLGARAQSIGDFRALLKDLEGKILPDGSVADHASVALARLRRDIERQRKSIQGSLERFLKSHQEEGVLQEEFVTIRNERFVVPIVAGQRRKIDGVIHAASASGHTLFVEPLETIDLNNELVRLTEEETQEVHRILRELTARLRGYAESIRQTMATLGELEMIFAKARFALDFDCAIPVSAPPAAARRAPSAVARRAPPPAQAAVVPISLELDERSKRCSSAARTPAARRSR